MRLADGYEPKFLPSLLAAGLVAGASMVCVGASASGGLPSRSDSSNRSAEVSKPQNTKQVRFDGDDGSGDERRDCMMISSELLRTSNVGMSRSTINSVGSDERRTFRTCSITGDEVVVESRPGKVSVYLPLEFGLDLSWLDDFQYSPDRPYEDLELSITGDFPRYDMKVIVDTIWALACETNATKLDVSGVKFYEASISAEFISRLGSSLMKRFGCIKIDSITFNAPISVADVCYIAAMYAKLGMKVINLQAVDWMSVIDVGQLKNAIAEFHVGVNVKLLKDVVLSVTSSPIVAAKEAMLLKPVKIVCPGPNRTSIEARSRANVYFD